MIIRLQDIEKENDRLKGLGIFGYIEMVLSESVTHPNNIIELTQDRYRAIREWKYTLLGHIPFPSKKREQKSTPPIPTAGSKDCGCSRKKRS